MTSFMRSTVSILAAFDEKSTIDAIDIHAKASPVSEPYQPRIIITTAGFGEGHNSAANNLASALESEAEVEVVDPCDRGSPNLNQQLWRFYRFVTTHTPQTLVSNL